MGFGVSDLVVVVLVMRCGLGFGCYNIHRSDWVHEVGLELT